MMTEDATARITVGSENDESATGRRTHKPKQGMFAACIDNAFDDKRVTIACISVWFVICLIGFTSLGIFGSEYMRVGPSDTLTYMGMRIQTMSRYLTVVGFVVISTAINDFASDAISPWIQNTVMDHKTRTIPYSKFTIVFITQTWSLYCGTMSVASIALVFAQFDLIMIRLVVDLMVNQYTIRRFLANKSHDPYRYHTEFLNEGDTDPFVDDIYDRDNETNMKPTAHDVQSDLSIPPRSQDSAVSSIASAAIEANAATVLGAQRDDGAGVQYDKKGSKKPRR
jgi:hypothetical protein